MWVKKDTRVIKDINGFGLNKKYNESKLENIENFNKDLLKYYIERFKSVLDTERGIELKESINERKENLELLLSKNKIDKLNKDGVVEILQYSWAVDLWSDYPYKAFEVIEKNTIKKFRKELKDLLYGKDTLGERFDNFKRNIKGLGAYYITEILAFIYPTECFLWNRKTADVVIHLGLHNFLPTCVWKHNTRISGENYTKCNRVMTRILDYMKECNFEKPNSLDLILLIEFIHANISKEDLKKIKQIAKSV